MNRQPKINIPMCAACVLLCLTLFSFHMSGGLYARYTTSAFGSDSARVARFDVSEDGASFSEELLMEIAPGVVTRTIHVVNSSEVAISYQVTIENVTNNIPFQFSINEGDPVENQCVAALHMEPNSSDSVTIRVIWDEEGALQYMGMVDLIQLSIRAEQVD